MMVSPLLIKLVPLKQEVLTRGVMEYLPLLTRHVLKHLGAHNRFPFEFKTLVMSIITLSVPQ